MRYKNLVRLFNPCIPIFSSKHKDRCMYFGELLRKLTEVMFKTHNENQQMQVPSRSSSWEMGESLNTASSTCVSFLLSFCQSVFLSAYLSSTSWLSTNKTLHMYRLFLQKSYNSSFDLAWVERLVIFSLVRLDCTGLLWRFSKVRHIIQHSLLKSRDYSSSWLCPDLALHGPFSSGTLPHIHTPFAPWCLHSGIFPFQESFTTQMGDPLLLSPAVDGTSAVSCQHRWKWSLLSNIRLLAVKCLQTFLPHLASGLHVIHISFYENFSFQASQLILLEQFHVLPHDSWLGTRCKTNLVSALKGFPSGQKDRFVETTNWQCTRSPAVTLR